MANTEDNSYSNFYDSELIVEFLQGLLPGDLHLKIQEQIKTSEVFRTYVEGVQISFENSGKDFEKMQADVAEKKAQTLAKLQQLKTKPTLGEKLSYTYEQLKNLFLPNPQLEYALQPTRAATTPQAKISIDDTNEILTLILSKKNAQVIDFEIFNNKIQSIQKHEISTDTEDFTLSTTALHPGIYYAQLLLDKPYLIRFYIQENLKPE